MTPPAVDRSSWELPDLSAPELAHITPELRPLAVPVGALLHLPGNAHQGDHGAVGVSLARFTQRVPLVVNGRTGHIEKGNTTWDVLVAAGHRWAAAVLVDDDPTVEKAFAVTDNRSAALGYDDPAALAALLIEIHQADEELFTATSYDGDDLDQLLSDLGIDLQADIDRLLDTSTLPPGQRPAPQPQPRAGDIDDDDMEDDGRTPIDLPRGTWTPPTNPDDDETADTTQQELTDGRNIPLVTFNIAVPKNLRHPLTRRLKQLVNETQTLTMGEALVHHFDLRPED